MPRVPWQQLHAPFDMEDSDVVVPPKHRKKRAHPEALLQAACCKLLRVMEKQGNLRFIAVMPEGMRAKKRAGWAKSMGLRAGVPDLLIFQYVNGRRRVVFVELKAKTGSMSESQLEWQQWLMQRGWAHHVVRGVDELQKVLEQ